MCISFYQVEDKENSEILYTSKMFDECLDFMYNCDYNIDELELHSVVYDGDICVSDFVYSKNDLY